MQNGEVNLANPLAASVAFKDGVSGIPNTTTTVIAGLEFQHIDFNQSNPYLALANVRHAIADGTNRAEIVQRLVTPLTDKIQPLQNRIWMPIQPQFQNTSGGYGDYNPSMATTLLKQSNMTMGSDGYFHPNFGPLAGKDLSFNISTTTGNSVRAEIEQLFQADMKAIGIKINIQNYNANTLFGTDLPKGEFDITQFAWVATPFASPNMSIYCSYTNPSLCGQNWNHYSDKQVDSLMTQAASTVNAAQAASLGTRSIRSCGRTWSPCRCSSRPSCTAGVTPTATSSPTPPTTASRGTPRSGGKRPHEAAPRFAPGPPRAGGGAG